MQDPQGRTALHVAATSGAIEVVSIICKFQPHGVNAVDAYGSTPLDNARMMQDTVIAALLEEAGAMRGTDASLHQQIHEVEEWVQKGNVEQQEKRRLEVLMALPEEQLAAAAVAVTQAQQEFVQVLAKITIFQPGMRCHCWSRELLDCWTRESESSQHVQLP